jgi:hypothetical protein
VPVDRSGLKLGALAGLLGISCCVGPAVLALLGVISVSFAIGLGTTLYDEYGWYFRGAAILLAAIGTFQTLKRRKSCGVRGAGAEWKLLLTVAACPLCETRSQCCSR